MLNLDSIQYAIGRAVNVTTIAANYVTVNPAMFSNVAQIALGAGLAAVIAYGSWVLGEKSSALDRGQQEALNIKIELAAIRENLSKQERIMWSIQGYMEKLEQRLDFHIGSSKPKADYEYRREDQ